MVLDLLCLVRVQDAGSGDLLLNRLPVQVRLLSHGERLLELKTLHTIQQDTQDNH